MTDDILSKCKTTDGYAAVKDVRTMELEDSMESFSWQKRSSMLT